MGKLRYGELDFRGTIGFQGLPPIAASKLLGIETQNGITLAVATGGSDTPSANRPARIVIGDYSAYPFATPQAALDSVPRLLRHTLTINVGAGNFPGFYVEGFHCGFNGNLQVNGTRGLATLATGPNTGIVPTLVSGRTITVTSAGWTVDDLVGRYVLVTAGPGAGQILMIAANGVDTITLVSVPSPAITVGSTLDIQDNLTVVTTPVGNYGIGVFNNVGYVYVNDFKVNAGTFRFVGTYCQNLLASRILTTGGTYGLLAQDCNRSAFNQVGALNASSIGAAFVSVSTAANGDRGVLAKGCGIGLYVEGNYFYVGFGGTYLRQCTAQAVLARGSPRFQVSNLLIDGCTTGVTLEALGWAILTSAQINNCSAGCFSMLRTQLQVDGSLTGTGNAGWGMYAKGPNNHVELKVLPTITGASGDTTVDGTTALVWATDLAVSGDFAVDTPSGTRIYRS